MSDKSPWSAPEVQPKTAPLEDEATLIDAPTGARFMAYIIDSLLVFIAIFIGIMVLMLPFILMDPDAADVALSEGEVMFDLGGRIGGFAISVLYGAIFEGSSLRATPGKLLFGLEVRDAFDQPLDFGGALKRNAVKMLALSCCGLLAFTALAGQGLWNEQSGHRVVKRV